MTNWTRRSAASAILALGLTGAGREETPMQAPEDIQSSRLQRGRLTVPVRVNGQGPFGFVIDSAANASVIDVVLAERLGLPPAGQIAMHTLIARELVETVRADHVETGALEAASVQLALATGLGLDGAAGLIGTDLLRGLRLDLRFRGASRARITRSRPTGGGFFDMKPGRARLLPALQQRFGGQLMIAAAVRGVEMLAILDTGAQVSIANGALAAATGATPIALQGGREAAVLSPTGRRAAAAPMLLSHLRFGGATIREAPLLVGNFHTFDLWGVSDRPAMLMGVDLLGVFRRVVIDLGGGTVLFEV